MPTIGKEKNLREQAEEIVREQPDLAEEIFQVVAETYQRADILERIEKRPDVNISDFTDEEIDELAGWFGEVLESNELYWAAYWKLADKTIDDYLMRQNKNAEKAPTFTDKTYHVDLYYGHVEGDDGIAHAFELMGINAHPDGDEVAEGFAEVLDTEPDNPLFNWDTIRMALPEAVVERIKSDAVQDYIAGAGKDDIVGEQKNTVVTYFYSDASNYHARNSAVLRGSMTEAQRRIVLDCLDGDGLFVPGAVGLDVELPWEYDPQEDHPFWGLDEDSFEETSQKPTVELTAEKFVAAFVANKDKWEQLGVAYTLEFADYKKATVEEIIEQAGVWCEDVGFGKETDRDIEMV